IEEVRQHAPELGAFSQAELVDEIRPVDGKRGSVEDRTRIELGGDPGAQLGQVVGIARDATADVIRLSQGEQVVDRGWADLREEAPDRGVAPGRLVPEHVLADEMNDGRSYRRRD